MEESLKSQNRIGQEFQEADDRKSVSPPSSFVRARMKLLNKIRIAAEFISFAWKARTLDELDSPYLFRLASSLYEDRKEISDDRFNRETEILRKELQRDRSFVLGADHGKISRVRMRPTARVSDVVRSSVSSLRKTRLLCNIVHHFAPATILELGTSLGLTTRYLAHMPGVAALTTVEGVRSIQRYAADRILTGIPAIISHCCSFSEFLVEAKSASRQYDLVYLDGDHSKQATCEYVEYIKPILSPGGVVIIDDIYWSSGMKRAWRTLREDDYFTVKVDLFYMGVLTTSSLLIKPIDVAILPFSLRWKPGLFR